MWPNLILTDTKYRTKRNKPQVAALQCGVGSMRGVTYRGQRTGGPYHADEAFVLSERQLMLRARRREEPRNGEMHSAARCSLLAARCTALGERWARATAHKRIRSLRFGEKTLFFQMKPPPGLRKPVVAQPQSHPGTTSLGNGVRPARAACGAASARGGEGRTQAGPEGHLRLLWSPRFAHVGKCGPW